MSRRRQLEHEVSVAQERIKKAAKDTPKDILKLWEQELVDLELELNNMVDDYTTLFRSYLVRLSLLLYMYSVLILWQCFFYYH